MLQDGAVPLGQDGKGDGAVVVLHHTDIVVPLRQGGLGLDVKVVGVPCRNAACSGYAHYELVQASAGAQQALEGSGSDVEAIDGPCRQQLVLGHAMLGLKEQVLKPESHPEASESGCGSLCRAQPGR